MGVDAEGLGGAEGRAGAVGRRAEGEVNAERGTEDDEGNGAMAVDGAGTTPASEGTTVEDAAAGSR